MDVVISSPAVLLLEHDITIRYPLAEYLRECGYTVFEATAAEDAGQLLDALTSGLTAAVMNLRSLSDAAAFEFAKRIRAEQASAEVFIVGTADAAADRVAGLCHATDLSRSKEQHKQHLLDHLMQLHAETLLKN
jgi:DNA-binding response OmpR family regulator